jgi:hypothetical protein
VLSRSHARAKAVDVWSSDAMVDRYERLYTELLDTELLDTDTVPA